MLLLDFEYYFGYTPAEPAISPLRRINRPLKTDWYNGTTYIRVFLMMR